MKYDSKYDHYSMNPAYEKHVQSLEKQGLTRSDAQGAADVKFDPHFAKKKSEVKTKVAKKMGGEALSWGKMTPEQKKKWLKTDKSVAKEKYIPHGTLLKGGKRQDNRDDTMKELDKQKGERIW